MPYKFATSCANLSTIEELTKAMDKMKECTFSEFIKHVPIIEINNNFPWDNSLAITKSELKADWHVKYYKSRYAGSKCYIMVHSSIEFVFVNSSTP